jgi:hypothetical protein
LHLSHTSAGTDERCCCALNRSHHEDDRGEVTLAELEKTRNQTEKTLLDAMDAAKEALRLQRLAEQAHRAAQQAFSEKLFAPFREEAQRLLSASSNA